MLLLAIDTSGKNGSIALARTSEQSADDVEIIEIMPLTGGTFSAQLIPQIADLLSSREHTKYDIGALAVASGPGSFTGLRIGLAAVKALGEILNKPIAAVSLLEACIFESGAKGTNESVRATKVMAALDAGRGEVYVGEYIVPADAAQTARERVLSRSELIEQAKGWEVVTPDSALAEVLRAAAVPVSLLAPPSAVTVARLGWRKIQAGETVTPGQLEANYVRRTDAEILERIGS